MHASNSRLIDGAIFEGAHEGTFRTRTAAEWLAIFGADNRAAVAIRGARNGQHTSFTAPSGAIWNLRPHNG